MESHCFDLPFSDYMWCRTSFHMLTCHLYILSEISAKVFVLFFLFFSNWAVCFLLLSFKCYFYILCEFFIRCVCKYFPLVCDLFSCSFGIVFRRSFFVSIKSNLLIIYLMDCAFGIVSKKSLPCPCSSIFSPMLFSRRVTDFLFYI